MRTTSSTGQCVILSAPQLLVLCTMLLATSTHNLQTVHYHLMGSASAMLFTFLRKQPVLKETGSLPGLHI